MQQTGAFTFVLHTHLPYARQAGMWPHGEEWVHEAIAETYVPLLDALNDLEEEGVPFKLTIGITPVLAEQLADPLIIEHFVNYAAERAARAGKDISRFDEIGDTISRDLARYYHHWYARVLTNFRDRYQSNLLGAFRRLQDSGKIEIATSAATHGYLPLLSRDSSIFGQLATGVETYKRHFGHAPTAIWLPECAYRSAVMEKQPSGTTVRRPGLESFLASLGLKVFFSETHTVEGGRPVGKATGEAIGLYANVPRRYAVSVSPGEQQEPGTTYQPYWVGDAVGQVAVLGRNNRTGQQVWSGTFGYPGDFWYREFHRKDGVSGLHYWRIGGTGVDLGDKPPYEPDRAAERVIEHAAHFVNLVGDLLAEYHQQTGKFGVISAAYDTELFGHWWFEGIDWIKQVLRGLAQREDVELTTATAIVENHPPERVLDLPESSWGAGGGHFTWLNIDTEWIWPQIHTAERRMEQLVAEFSTPTDQQQNLLAQATRELLLLESSDWPFLITTGQAKEYAIQRFTEHLDRFNELADLLETRKELTEAEKEVVALVEERDNPFTTIDPRTFAARQGDASIHGES